MNPTFENDSEAAFGDRLEALGREPGAVSSELRKALLAKLRAYSSVSRKSLLARIGLPDHPVRKDFEAYFDRCEQHLNRIKQAQEDRAARRLTHNILIPEVSAASLSGYRLEKEIGQGSNGFVYLARPLGASPFSEPLAIKIFSQTLYRPGLTIATHVIAHEQNLERVKDPRIVNILSAGTGHLKRDSDETLSGDPIGFTVMEYVEGVNLRVWMQEARKGQPVEILAAAKILIRMAEALEIVHKAGLLHRDVKPSNVIGCDEEEMQSEHLKLSNLNITNSAPPPTSQDLDIEHLKLSDFGSSLIRTDAAVSRQRAGTPGYMAPEQILGQEKVPADIYSMGITFLFLLSGRTFTDENDGRAFFGEDDHRAFREIGHLLSHQHQHDERLKDLWQQYQDIMEPEKLCKSIPTSTDPCVTLQLRGATAIVRRCIATDPLQRYPNAEAVADDLHALLKDTPIPSASYSKREAVKMFLRRCRRTDENADYQAEFDTDRRTGWGIAFFVLALLNGAVELLDHVLRASGLEIHVANQICNGVLIPSGLAVIGVAWYAMKGKNAILPIGSMLFIFIACTISTLCIIVPPENLVLLTQILFLLLTMLINSLSVIYPAWTMLKYAGWLSLLGMVCVSWIGSDRPDVLEQYGPSIMGFSMIAFLVSVGYGMIDWERLRNTRLLNQLDR